MSNTGRVVAELGSFLAKNNYYKEESAVEIINANITSSWGLKVQDSIKSDFVLKNQNAEIYFAFSEFYLFDDRSQGACIFIHFANVKDEKSGETLKIIIKSIINYKRTVVYLDSVYANIDRYYGKSEMLKALFTALKKSDENFGYFNPINLEELVF